MNIHRSVPHPLKASNDISRDDLDNLVVTLCTVSAGEVLVLVAAPSLVPAVIYNGGEKND